MRSKFPDYVQGDAAIGCFGPSTAKAIEEAGLRLDCERRAGLSSMTAALETLYRRTISFIRVSEPLYER